MIPPLNSLQLMFQGPSNVIRKRYHKLLDYENAVNRLGNLKDGDLISTVSVTRSHLRVLPDTIYNLRMQSVMHICVKLAELVAGSIDLDNTDLIKGVFSLHICCLWFVVE